MAKRFDISNTYALPNSLQRMTEFSAMRLASDIEKSFMSVSQQIKGITATQKMSELLASSTLRHLSELQASSTMRHLSELQASSSMRQLSELQALSVTRMADELGGISAASIASALHDNATITALRELHDSSLMSALSKLRGSPVDYALFQSAVDIARRIEIPLEAEQNELPEEWAEVQAEIEAAVSDELDFYSLSDRTRSILFFIFKDLVLPIILIVAGHVAIKVYESKTLTLENATTPNEVHQLSRCMNAIEKDALNGCRVVTEDDLRLRAGPGMKHHVLTKLPLGKMLIVLDSSNRPWLHVEVDVDGEIQEGWVARRHTSPFR